MMNKPSFSKRPVLLALVLALAAPAGPAIAQSAGDAAAAETRLRKLEAEIAALQRQVFPGGDGKYFAPLVQPGTTDGKTLGTPASTPVSDLLVRMDAVEAQLARLTSQQEVTTNKLTQLEAKVTALAPPPPAAPALAAAGDNGAVTAGNLGAMTGGAAGPKPAAPAPAVAVAPEAAAPKPAVAAPTPKPVVAAPAPKPATPSAQRLAAVKAVEKPATADPADDEYSYGFRLWEKKFYPEAQQQLKLYSAEVSQARPGQLCPQPAGPRLSGRRQPARGGKLVPAELSGEQEGRPRPRQLAVPGRIDAPVEGQHPRLRGAGPVRG